jgi:hypothetical protein
MVQIFHHEIRPGDPFQAAPVSSRTRGATPHALCGGSGCSYLGGRMHPLSHLLLLENVRGQYSIILGGSSCGTPPSRPRASPRSRASACGPHDSQRPAPTSKAFASQRVGLLLALMRATTRPSAITPGSCGLTPASPPAEKATARQDQAGKASTDDGAGDGGDGSNRYRASL